MKPKLDLSQIFKDSHRDKDKKDKLFKRLEKLRLKNIEALKTYKNDIKLEICEMLRIWLEASGIKNKSKVKLYRIKDRLKDLISFYKNFHDKSKSIIHKIHSILLKGTPLVVEIDFD